MKFAAIYNIEMLEKNERKNQIQSNPMKNVVKTFCDRFYFFIFLTVEKMMQNMANCQSSTETYKCQDKSHALPVV